MLPTNTFSDWPTNAGANAKESVLASDLVIEGDLTSDGPVDVQGRLIGSIRAPVAVIAGSGQIEGSIVAHDLSVVGAVSGTISARVVKLAMSAVVHADIIHERITIEAGAEIEGRLYRKV